MTKPKGKINVDITTKALKNTDTDGTSKNVSNLVRYGNADSFKLLCKASSEEEGWMKSTKVLAIPGVGCIVQVTTQQRNPDGSYVVAEALTFVPGVKVISHAQNDDDIHILVKE